MKKKWWGYLHTEGTIHTRRFLSNEDIAEAQSSPFVKQVYGPWECDTKEEAERKIRNEMP